MRAHEMAPCCVARTPRKIALRAHAVRPLHRIAGDMQAVVDRVQPFIAVAEEQAERYLTKKARKRFLQATGPFLLVLTFIEDGASSRLASSLRAVRHPHTLSLRLSAHRLLALASVQACASSCAGPSSTIT